MKVESKYPVASRLALHGGPPPRKYLEHNNPTNYVGYLEIVKRVYENKIRKGIIMR